MRQCGRLVLVLAFILPLGGGLGSAAAAPPGERVTPNYPKLFESLAKRMRARYKSNNTSLTPCCMSWLDEWAGNSAQSAEIEVLKAKGAAIIGEEEAKGGGRNWTSGLQIYLRYGALVQRTVVGGFHVGNCGEMSAALFRFIYDHYPEVEVNLVSAIGGNHTFVLARLPGGETFVVDPWKGTSLGGIVYSGEQIYKTGDPEVDPHYSEKYGSETGWVKKPPAEPAK